MHRGLNYSGRFFSSMATAGKTSSVSQKLKIGPLKKLYKYMTPGSISLAGGLPMDSCFPFKSINVQVSDGSQFTLQNSQDLLMNYTRGDGIAALKPWIANHVNELHRPIQGVETCVTVGSSDAWAKVVQLIDTDAVVYDQFAYGAATNLAEVLGKQSLGVPCDQHGMIPDELRRSVLAARAKGIKVNLIYLVPVGQNPAGFTMPLERKESLYQVCQELDLIIAEDGMCNSVELLVVLSNFTVHFRRLLLPLLRIERS